MPPKSHKPAGVEGLGDWLKAMRERADLTQEAAAVRAGVRLGIVQKSEGGRDLRLSNFLALARAYGAKPDDLARLLGAVGKRPLRKASADAFPPAPTSRRRAAQDEG